LHARNDDDDVCTVPESLSAWAWIIQNPDLVGFISARDLTLISPTCVSIVLCNR